MNRGTVRQNRGRQARGIPRVLTDSNGRKSGAGDFAVGFVLGGVVFGALGCLLAPYMSKFLSAIDRDNEGLEEKTRRNLNEKIAQLNAAIDDLSAQLRADHGLDTSAPSVAELDTAV